MSKKKPASVYTGIRIPPELREEAQRRAEDQGRSLSNYIKRLIARDLKVAETEPDDGYRVKKKAQK